VELPPDWAGYRQLPSLHMTLMYTLAGRILELGRLIRLRQQLRHVQWRWSIKRWPVSFWRQWRGWKHINGLW